MGSMALALLIFLCLLALTSMWLFIAHPWWMPAAASVEALSVDHQFKVTLILIGVTFCLAQIALAVLVWRYRSHARREPRRTYACGDARVELLWTTATALLFLSFAWSGAQTWEAAHFNAFQSSNDLLHVEVTATQFAWYFHYPGADRRLGRTSPELMDPSQGNAAAVGLDYRDPAAKDDIVTQTLVIPVGRPVVLTLRSTDVIHSFFVPELRFKQDAVPGQINSATFHPERPGSYEIACAQLCGLGHYKMRAQLQIVNEPEYERWLAEQAARR
jgi:cytochrome c oxidase subunit II